MKVSAVVMAAGGNGRFGGIAEKHALRWREVWLEGNNPDIDSPMDLERLR